MRRVRTALAVSLLLGSGCAKPADPVRATLDRIVQRVNESNADAVMRNVSADFQLADGRSRADAEGILRSVLNAYESLDVRLENVRVERAETGARVRMRVVASGRPTKLGGMSGLLPSSAKYDFDLRLGQDGGSWKVAWASWQEAGD